MLSIFSPRVDVKKDGTVVSRNALIKCEFDKYYLDPVLKKKAVKVGEGNDDFIVVDVVTYDKRSIDETINTQNKFAPVIEESIRRFAETGDLAAIPPQMNDGVVTDFTVLPQDHAEYMAYMKKVAVAYDNLPADLKGKMTMEDFILKTSDADIESYLNNLKPKEDVKEEVK